jgi:magnesium chelatase subunit D
LSEPEDAALDGGLEASFPRRKNPGRGRLRTRAGSGKTGRFIRPALPAPGESVTDPALLATLQAAALRRAEEGAGGRTVLPSDIRKKIRAARSSGLILFLVDASDSMGASAQLAAAKGAVFSLLRAAYIRRDRVGLIAFRGQEAMTLLPPTSSIHLARKKLRRLASGGATPFADGLLKAWNIIRAEKLKRSPQEAVLVVVSDGEANVPLAPGGDKTAEIRGLGQRIRAEGVKTIFVDTNPPGTNRPEAVMVAGTLGAELRRISRPGSRDLAEAAE